MIDVFEKWFNQFTKPEQEKLLKHIRKNHFDLSDGLSSNPTGNMGKRLLTVPMSTSRKKESSISRRLSK